MGCCDPGCRAQDVYRLPQAARTGVLEGHARLTAFLLARDRLLPELEVLVGSSPAMTRWGLW